MDRFSGEPDSTSKVAPGPIPVNRRKRRFPFGDRARADRKGAVTSGSP
jgi:hypothetical protein